MINLSKTLFVAMLFSTFIFFACDKNNPTEPAGTDESETVSLDKVNGGYTAEDEAPGFGDTELIAEYDEAAASVSDPYTAQTDSAIEQTTFPAYFVRLTWGMLQGDTTITATTDWSGTISVNKGVLAVQKSILFEQGDYIHLPRESRLAVDFTSSTNIHFDGIGFVIVDNDTTNSQGLLTINAGQYTRTFTFSELDSIELIETVDEIGNEFSIISKSKDVHAFAGGFFAGRWMRFNARGGNFEGRWIDCLGTSIGYLRGIWGQNLRGMNVMYGKYIHRDGTFGGLLKGEWGANDSQGAIGWLEGQWVNRNGSSVGHFKGVWRTHPEVEGKGFFNGRWERNDGQPESENVE
ncbi:MAG: hypothetical protein H6696_21245 [Deferribacteres bacterium]|nr:hypothetical protein [candidate division KSB1 bacterium]MCB9504460.1 hypothetical protein [Deferribacteres bacterium]